MFLINSYRFIFIMPSLLYTILGLAVGTLHCSVRQQISPCTCNYEAYPGPNSINVICEKMTSFAEVKHALKGHFKSPNTRVRLRITHSNLNDLTTINGESALDNFQDIEAYITHLNISDNNLTAVRADVFLNMTSVLFLNLANNFLNHVPVDAISNMPKLLSLSLGGNRINKLLNTDLQNVKGLETLVLADNLLEELGDNSIPKGVLRLSLQRNKLESLNGAIRDLHSLEWLFIAENNLLTLEDQLPTNSKIHFLNTSHNSIQNLPVNDLRNFASMEHFYADHNEIESLAGSISKAKRLLTFSATYNNITILEEKDFSETESLEQLLLGHNQISVLNRALKPLRAVKRVSLHHNLLKEFDLAEINGLRTLQELDLRHNLIENLYSNIEIQNAIEVDTPQVSELRLGHNLLTQLDGFLRGLPGLRWLDLSHNKFKHLPPDELLGLEHLKYLDISNNKLTTLSDMAKKTLPNLETLNAAHNDLTVLDNDLHGLPGLCFADLSKNKIERVSVEVSQKSKCWIRGVVRGTLRIGLQGNKLVCNKELAMAQEETDKNRAELVGVPDCNLATFLEAIDKTSSEEIEKPIILPPLLQNNSEEEIIDINFLTTPPAE